MDHHPDLTFGFFSSHVFLVFDEHALKWHPQWCHLELNQFHGTKRSINWQPAWMLPVHTRLFVCSKKPNGIDWSKLLTPSCEASSLWVHFHESSCISKLQVDCKRWKIQRLSIQRLSSWVWQWLEKLLINPTSKSQNVWSQLTFNHSFWVKIFWFTCDASTKRPYRSKNIE